MYFRRLKLCSLNSCTEGSKREASDLECLSAEGDKYESAAKNYTDYPHDYGVEKAKKAEPKSVAEAMSIEVGLNYLAEGAEAELRKLEVLDAERNTNDGNAEYKTKKEEEYAADKSTEDEPKNVAESSHEKRLLVLLMYVAVRTLIPFT